jgi:DNA-binding GntR family transcriptional regulator
MTASDAIAASLRSSILSLKLLPGSELNLQEMADRLGTSRSPVRDALLKLRDERLVDIIPQSGTRVARINLSQVEVERFLRSSLEQDAAGLFCRKRKEKDLLSMDGAIQKQKEAKEAGDMVAFLTSDDDFHHVVFSSTGLERIWNIIQKESGNYHRIRLLSFGEPDVLANIILRHQELESAFRGGNEALVKELEAGHMGKLEQERVVLLDRYPDYFTKDEKEWTL